MVNPLLSPSTSFWSILLPTLRINPSPTWSRFDPMAHVCPTGV
jgi:hypothetical protein